MTIIIHFSDPNDTLSQFEIIRRQLENSMLEPCDYSHYTEISSLGPSGPSLELDVKSLVIDTYPDIYNDPRYAQIQKVYPKIED